MAPAIFGYPPREGSASYHRRQSLALDTSPRFDLGHAQKLAWLVLQGRRGLSAEDFPYGGMVHKGNAETGKGLLFDLTDPLSGDAHADARLLQSEPIDQTERYGLPMSPRVRLTTARGLFATLAAQVYQ